MLSDIFLARNIYSNLIRGNDLYLRFCGIYITWCKQFKNSLHFFFLGNNLQVILWAVKKLNKIKQLLFRYVLERMLQIIEASHFIRSQEQCYIIYDCYQNVKLIKLIVRRRLFFSFQCTTLILRFKKSSFPPAIQLSELSILRFWMF